MMTAELVIKSVVDAGNDVLLVTASDGVKEFTAEGHVSATTQHYDASSYAEFYNDANGGWVQVTATSPAPADAITDRHLVANAQPRAMTATEVGEYALTLVLAQNAQLQAAPAIAVTFTPPAPVPLPS